MKFNIKKYKAFTVGELMIMLSVLTILLAAFAPVFTVRYNNASSEYVWQFVSDSEEFDAYSDQISKAMTAQSFIGITPASKAMATSAVSNAGNVLYSKLVVRPTHFTFDNEIQKTIQFRYGDSLGPSAPVVGTLVARNGNILLGGTYTDLKPAATNNTFYGRCKAGYSVTTGQRNTALGYEITLQTTNDNTVISNNLYTYANGNTLALLSPKANSHFAAYNVVLGKTADEVGTGNTLFATSIAKTGDYNTILSSAHTAELGSYNVIAGVNASTNTTKGFGYNTIIGYYAGSGLGSNTMYHTCIGYESCKRMAATDNQNTRESVFIGSRPADGTNGSAVLTVQKDSSDATVYVNGNLVVRGQTYLTVTPQDGHMGLYGFRFINPQPGNMGGTHKRTFGGYDYTFKDVKRNVKCGNKVQTKKFKDAYGGCVCVDSRGDNNAAVKSYDWVSPTSDSDEGNNNGSKYYDKSVGRTFTRNIDKEINFAHMPTSSGKGSCCPDLKSDIRLKNLSGKFVDNLDAIRNITPYNFTYKEDAAKHPQVGVMAQDLKAVFPNAVTKDETGYYQIRWDEMLYAAVNAIKALNEKVVALAQRVVNDQNRISALKKDNKELIDRLDVLSARLTAIENK